jgi:hypothetical protein
VAGVGTRVRCDFVAPREMFKGLESSLKEPHTTGAHIGETCGGRARVFSCI